MINSLFFSALTALGYFRKTGAFVLSSLTALLGRIGLLARLLRAIIKWPATVGSLLCDGGRYPAARTRAPLEGNGLWDSGRLWDS
jgi:hypothetical protein